MSEVRNTQYVAFSAEDLRLLAMSMRTHRTFLRSSDSESYDDYLERSKQPQETFTEILLRDYGIKEDESLED